MKSTRTTKPVADPDWRRKKRKKEARAANIPAMTERAKAEVELNPKD